MSTTYKKLEMLSKVRSDIRDQKQTETNCK